MRRYFTVEGQPQGKGRARTVTHGGKVHSYTPHKTAEYEQLIRWSYQMAYPLEKPLTGAVEMNIRAVFAVPKSWPLRRRHEALAGLIPVTVKPDCDNIMKCMDALNGIAWEDDKQITFASVEKVYGIDPRLEIELKNFERRATE